MVDAFRLRQFGPKVSLRGGQIEIGANLGTRRGDNLFHSFD
jgi:hypothetical protein